MSSTICPLLIPELLLVVLDFLAEPSLTSLDGFPFPMPSQDSLCALAIVARTCRVFTEPALDLLWRRLNSLEPLIWCFTPRKDVISGRTPVHPPSAQEWVVIRRYAARIQQLEVRNDLSSFILGCAMFEINLFPNLRALKWGSKTNSDRIGISLIQPLLGPRITTLDVSGTQHDMAIGSFLRTLPLRCPRVIALKLCIILPDGFQLMDVYSQALCNFKHLRCLQVEPYVNDCALEHLFTSPLLQDLGLCIWPLRVSGIPLPPSVIPLPNVQTLTLRLPWLNLLTDLLRPGEQHFRAISLAIGNLELPTTFGDLFTGLAMHPHNSSLQLLHIRSPRPYTFKNDFAPFVVTLDTFAPLACHTHLRELVINLENPIALDDVDLAELARNWPSLQQLELCYVRRLPQGFQQLTLHGLLALVALCPDLRHVGLTLDAREVPSDVQLAARSYRITTLRFFNSRIDDRAEVVATFLLAHFPWLTVVHTDMEACPLHRRVDAWVRVGEYVANPSKLACGATKAGGRHDLDHWSMEL